MTIAMSATPHRNLTVDEIETLGRDGVICVRGALDGEWVEHVRGALHEAAARPTLPGRFLSRRKKGLYHDMFVWLKHDRMRELWFHSPLAQLAAQALDAKRVNLFYDEIFCKEPGSTMPTPWHQDIAAWPVTGEQLLNMWVPVDRVTRENSPLEFVRGSHRWGATYKVESAISDVILLAPELDWAPDVEANRDQYDIVQWDMEPGDALLFSPSILHGSRGNSSHANGRRAIALRFTGEDMRYDPRPHTMPLLYKHGLSEGDPIGGPLFPEVWPNPPADLGQSRPPFAMSALLAYMRTQLKGEIDRVVNPKRYKRHSGQMR